MSSRRRFLSLLLGFAFLVTGALLFAWHRQAHRVADEEATFRLSDRLATVQVVETEAGRMVRTGSGDLVTPTVFLDRLAGLQQAREDGGWLFRVLDITSFGGVAWVLIGFAGQFLFTGRMVVQWLASEKAGRSVVPAIFWWLSLTGSSMLIIYFSWRIDIVGILGQSTGWFIYLRNLWLIHKLQPEAEAPAKEVGR